MSPYAMSSNLVIAAILLLVSVPFAGCTELPCPRSYWGVTMHQDRARENIEPARARTDYVFTDFPDRSVRAKKTYDHYEASAKVLATDEVYFAVVRLVGAPVPHDETVRQQMHTTFHELNLGTPSDPNPTFMGAGGSCE